MEYDFIIVGTGPAGASVAFALAQSPKQPKVLILEAGGLNDDKSLRTDGQRWLTFLQQDLNFGYKTSPQEHAGNRQIDYSRGKGLGGSSAINFGVFTVGAKHDYDTWAKLVNDEEFTWSCMQQRFKKIVTFHRDIPEGVDPKYASPLAKNHSSSGGGPLHVGYAKEWEEDLIPTLDLLSEGAGYPLNPDHNSGNPIGLSVLISSAYNGVRSTSKDLLGSLPENFTVKTFSAVEKVIFDGNRATRVVTVDGDTFLASKEVILSAGALDSPKILMHSGIGPLDQLSEYQIPVIHPSPFVGQNLRDHAFVPLVHQRKPGSSLSTRSVFYGSLKRQEEAMKQWQKDGTGEWSKYACEVGIGFFKLGERFLTSKEFERLPESEKEYLRDETVPHTEVFTHFPFHWFFPGGDFPRGDEDKLVDYSCFLVFLYNAQSRGEVRLQSRDPKVPLKFDPKFLGHEFDRRAAVESLREFIERAIESEGFKKAVVRQIVGPEGNSDEKLLEFWQQAMSSSWHMTGTAKMGRDGDEEAVVDEEFRVRGVKGLRVADMSVVPVLVSAHTQGVAYVTGYTCGEKLLKEYDLL
ncbi:oxidoreductase [Podospora fimiseda]|uniref:Oxidoreductase n=1 Tax=Podospora fimiseda TaxID=252190 RepID=A0AAN7BDU9_9PEZI|nr:oxidoreductase [Podospora fimiseda]